MLAMHSDSKWTTLKDILTKHDFSTTFINNLQTPTTARTQHFYGLPKTHKTNLKIQPIVSACGGIFDRLGWFLQQLLKPLLSHVKAHLNSTTDLLARFNAKEESKLSGTIPISFDVVSLYTNINVEEAIETSLEYALKHKLNLYGLRTDKRFELHLILDNNIFWIRKHAFQTNPWTSYGQQPQWNPSHSDHGQIRVQMHLPSDKANHLCTICGQYRHHSADYRGSTRNTPYDELQTSHLKIRAGSSRCCRFPAHSRCHNLKIKINGSMERKLYTKPANKGITLNYRSHHPSSTKLAVTTKIMNSTEPCGVHPKNMWKTQCKEHAKN